MGTMKIDAWSYSRISVFEKCKHHAELKFIRKIPEPERPLPAGKKEHANDRGSRIHKLAELYVFNKLASLPKELEFFEEEFKTLKELWLHGGVSLEGEWAVDRDWAPVEWRSPSAWGRIQLDAFVHLSPIHAVVIDYKTGKRAGNEIKHAEQMQLYQLSAFLRYPQLEVIDVELWYLDLDEITKVRYTRNQGLKYFKPFNDRAVEMTEATHFPANPNIFSCKWCPYGPKGTNDCPKGVQ